MATAVVLPNSRPRLVRNRAEVVKLKPQTIDELAKKFLATKLRVDVAAAELAHAKESLLELVKLHGAVPAKADKSKRLSGDIYDITATFGTTTSVDTGAAEH